jgi:hypothetical protein
MVGEPSRPIHKRVHDELFPSGEPNSFADYGRYAGHEVLFDAMLFNGLLPVVVELRPARLSRPLNPPSNRRLSALDFAFSGLAESRC